ncbi:hypothetical protein Tco_0837261 [Tanacetum coccineum]
MVAYLLKPEGSEDFHQIIDFLSTSHINTPENEEMEITVIIDRKVKVVSEASIRRHLKLEDSDGISTLLNAEIFEQLALKGASSTSQLPTSPPSMQTTHVAKEAAIMPHDSPLLRVHSLRSDEGSMTLNELTVLYTTLSKKVETLEYDLKQTKLTYGVAYTKLIMKVKKLEHKLKSSKARRRGRLRRHEHDFVEPNFEEDYTAEPDISTANVPVSTNGAEVSTASGLVSTVEPPKKIKKRVQIQMSIDEELAQKLHEEEQARFNAKQEAKVAADEDLVQQLQAGEKYSEEDLPRKLVELVNQRKKFYSQQRAEAKRNKPMTPAQQKAYMSTYIKNKEGDYSIKKLKVKAAAKIRVIQVKAVEETTAV